MTPTDALLLIHAGVTLAMTGLIWFVQIVHYPLFDRVGAAQFVEYERVHQMRTTWVVAPLMLTELTTAAALAVWRPDTVSAWGVWVGLALVALLWALTALVQVPAHRALGSGFDPAVHRRLARSNWWRTVFWTARGLLALWLVKEGLA